MSNTPPPRYQRSVPTLTVTSPTSPSIASVSLKSPRAARFAEDTAVVSPIDGRNPFKDPPTNHYKPQAQVSDIGFGYLNNVQTVAVEMEETDEKYFPQPPKSPLKSALKTPGAAPRNLDALLSPTFREETILSPTWKHEEDLEKAEKQNDVEQKRDLKSKMRVRWAKVLLRGVNFSCSLIVLSMLATTFSIFNATKALPPRNNLPAWAPGTAPWAQIVLLCISCVSLATCMIVFWGYWRGGHRRAEKVAVYYTTFTVAFFVFSIVMWIVGAVMINQAKQNGNGQDMWGWSCKDNRRKDLFDTEVQYALVCRLQNWSLICAIIEIVVEVFAIIIYGITFYRYYTKRRLRKTMAARDRARSDLYLAQLRMQSAPNTPGLPGGLMSPRDGGWQPPQGFDSYNDEKARDGTQFVLAAPPAAAKKPFALKAAPKSRTAKIAEQQEEVKELDDSTDDDEPTYGSVSIPGAYSVPNSPGMPPSHQGSIDSRLKK